MSTTITYKGSTLTTVENATKKLTTSGTWLEDDITITDVTSGGGGSVLVEENENSTGTQLDITATSTVYLQPWFSVTPSASEQQISPASGYDAMSGFTVEAIPSEYVIPSGMLSISENGTYDVSAFASAEVLVSGGGGGSNKEIEIIERTISGTYENSNVTKIGSAAFNYCSTLNAVSFPNATSIGSNAFMYCSVLRAANFQNATSIASSAFYGCSVLSSISFPNATYVGNNAFYGCSALSEVSLPKAITISAYAFSGCFALNTVILSNDTIANININANTFLNCYNLLSLYLLSSTRIYALSNANAFTSTPISNYTTSTGGVQGSIFVPEGVYSSYITATNWITYSDRFVSLTDAQIQNVLDYGRHDP